MDKPKGYILLYKQLQSSWLWTDKPFSKGQAWIDLLLMANFTDGEMLSKGAVIPIKRGQVFRTMGYLADRWGWSLKKTKGFMSTLENQKMVLLEGLPQGTRITIEKYEFYQDAGTPKEPPEGLSRDYAGTSQGLQKKEEKRRIKKDKEEIKKYIAEIVYYLNDMTGQHYRTTTQKTIDLIEKWLKQGFTVEDFKTVIYKKTNEWKNDPKMVKFLRPETLFGNKFEGYLNEITVSSNASRWEVDF